MVALYERKHARASDDSPRLNRIHRHFISLTGHLLFTGILFSAYAAKFSHELRE
jgi:hypothetical protein